MKPATQNGSGIPLNLNAGLVVGTKLGKAAFSLSDNPKLSALFKPTISKRPFSVKWSPFLIISKACLNNKKSEYLAVINGYFTQWSMITCISFIEYILKLAVSLLCNVIVPTPKLFFI